MIDMFSWHFTHVQWNLTKKTFKNNQKSHIWPCVLVNIGSGYGLLQHTVKWTMLDILSISSLQRYHFGVKIKNMKSTWKYCLQTGGYFVQNLGCYEWSKL